MSGSKLIPHGGLVPHAALDLQYTLNSSTKPSSFFLPPVCRLSARKLSISRTFDYRLTDKNLLKRNSRGFRLMQRFFTVSPRAVLAMEPSSELAGKFRLDGDIEMEVYVSKHSTGSATRVDIQINNGSESFLLHWGAVGDKTGKKWVFPASRPDGTTNYKNRALRSPFAKTGSRAQLKIEINDPDIHALEFLILDESRNKWFKDNGNNFHIKLPSRVGLPSSNLSIPEDLVQIQAYLRWERKGKQMYTPDQEKAEYEAARLEILEELAKGVTIEAIRGKLTKQNEQQERFQTVNEMKSKIPNDLVQIQAYIRWEKAGKPNYPPEKQLLEFEEARQELQAELDSGLSLDEIKKRITTGQIKTKVAKQLKDKNYFTIQRVQRKNRDLMQLVTKHQSSAPVIESFIEEPPVKAVEVFANTAQAQDGSSVLNKKIFKVDDKDLLVLVTKCNGKTKVLLASDYRGPLTAHWALSKEDREWVAPPDAMLPPGSILLGEAAETQMIASIHDTQIKVLEIEVDGKIYRGMPFVLLSNGKWIKDKGSDFYVEFHSRVMEMKKDFTTGRGTAKMLLDKIAGMESEAQKSFMHRFNIAADLVDEAKASGELGFAGILVWMRFMATRQLIWNKNYNVKPREISKAQDRLTDLLQSAYTSHPQYREFLRMILSTVGRGGEGDVGQRIRDEILVIQRNNDCKGGMMEEWHQKLHNNTSPDDVIICQALLNYIRGDFDVSLYWKTLNENGITKERLLSYDRAIHSEPNFRRDQRDGLLRDLGNYLRTLKAVHSGADLESAIANCMGYKSEGQGFMVGVHINPISGLPSGFPELLQFVMDNIDDRQVEPLLEGLLEARQELRPLLWKPNARLKDLLFLDLALDSAVRTVVEREYESLDSSGHEKIMYYISLVLENLALSSDNNEELIYCLKGWNHALKIAKHKASNWALYSKSILDRTRLALTSKAEWYQKTLQPSANYLGSLLGVDQWAVNIFTEEIIRAGSAAALSSLLNRLDPVLRKTANLGSWQVISPVETVGFVVVVDELLSVQNKTYEQPTIIVAKKVRGEEEIPSGAVAVLTPDMPDVLSHVSVRARNSKVCFATCFDSNILFDLQAKEGKLLSLQPTSADVVYRETNDITYVGSNSSSRNEDRSATIKLIKKQFSGFYAISSDDFTPEMVGAKSRNISYLKGKVPSWIGIPTSVALPFGVFEKVLSDEINAKVAKKVKVLNENLRGGDINTLREVRETVLEMAAPPQLVRELKSRMQDSGMPWPGDEGEQRWNEAWMAIKKVWASKWNERAYFSTRKVKLNHDYLTMAVLVQEIINADYAFVIHTTNPSSGDSSEIYVEVVRGLGETLVGAYPGRALSFICKKTNLDSPQILGYPSKPIGLFIKRTIIFRSDSNGEDLEGYAGAGLYDSVPMDETQKVVLDYSSDPLITDDGFQKTTLSSIARAGLAIEELYGSPQDIEGVVRDGQVYVVQTRPQM